MIKSNQFKTFLASKLGNSTIVVYKCHTKSKPELVQTLGNLTDSRKAVAYARQYRARLSHIQLGRRSETR